MYRGFVKAGLGLAAAGWLSAAQAATEIQWWHAMGGQLGEWVAGLAEEFNASQSDYKVVAVYKGNYTETLTAAIAAFRAKQQPHIVQVFEVGTATMMAAKGAVKPVYQVMADAKEPFDPKVYIPAIVGYYSTPDGKMLSLPLNSSTPVLYYNKDAFKKAGLDPAKPPATWPEVGEYGQKLLAAGYKCGFTTQWQTWIQLENFSALHNVPFATKENGMAGLDTELVFNGPLQVKHIAEMAEWQKSKVFEYGGRMATPDGKFIAGECPIFMASSGSYGGFKQNIKDFEFGVGFLPYDPAKKGAPQNSIIGGATLWVLNGHPEAEYKGVAKFFTFLSKPEVQAKSHQRTGYLPITTAAYELTRSQGYYDKNPGTDVAVKQLNLNPPTENSKGLRLGSFTQIRDIMDEELENVWSGKKTAKEGLDSAVTRGNELLRRFEQQNKGG